MLQKAVWAGWRGCAGARPEPAGAGSAARGAYFVEHLVICAFDGDADGICRACACVRADCAATWPRMARGAPYFLDLEPRIA